MIPRNLDAERDLLAHHSNSRAENRAARDFHKAMCRRIEQACEEIGADPMMWRPHMDWTHEGVEEALDLGAYACAGYHTGQVLVPRARIRAGLAVKAWAAHRQ